MNRLWLVFPAAFTILLAWAAMRPVNSRPAAAAPPAAPSPAAAPGARLTEFPNGATLIVREDRSAPVVSVQAWCRTGSIHEGKWLGSGISHILEHMLFKGTTTRGVADIARTVQAAGGYMNAYTSFDRTVYYIDAPSTGWGACLDVVADVVLNATLPEAEYDREQEVIRREFAMGLDDPDRQSHYLHFDTAYTAHPYRYPVIGHLDVYNRLARQDVFEYYQQRYAPNNLTFLVVGDVAFEDVRARIAPLLEKHPRRPLPDVFVPREPAQLARRDAHREFATALTRLSVSWHIPDITHPDVYPLDVLAVVLGNGRSSRLHQELVEKRKLVHAVDAWCYTPGEAGLFGVDAVCDPDKREAAAAAILDIAGRVRREPVAPAELEKARNQLLASHYRQSQTMSGQAADLGTSWFLTRTLDFSERYLERVRTVTADAVLRAAGNYLDPANLTVTSLNPKGSLKTAAAAPAAAVQAAPVEAVALSNGVRVLLHRNPKVPMIALRAAFRSGVVHETAANNGISRLAAQCLVKGTKSRSAAEIAAEIENLGGAIGTDSGLNSTVAAVDVLSKDLDRGLSLLADVLLHPTYPADEVDKERALQLAAIQQEQDQIMALCRNLLRENLFGPGHPYALNPLGTRETLAALTPAALAAHHRVLCTGRNLVVALFGDLPERDLKPALEKAFGAFAAADPPALPPFAAPNPAEPVRVVQNADKAQAVVQIGFPGAAVDSPDRFALELIEDALSDMASRLFLRIREQQGLAYFVGSAQRQGLRTGHFVFYAGCDPAKADHVVTELLDEVAKLAASGLEPDEFERAKAKLLGALKMERQNLGGFAQRVALDELMGLGPRFYQEQEAKVAALTLSDASAAAAKYFARPGHVTAVVRPKEPEAP